MTALKTSSALVGATSLLVAAATSLLVAAATSLLVAACGSSLNTDSPSDTAGGTGNDATGSGGAASGTGGSIELPDEPVSAFLIVDQFGYRPNSEKIAVLRDPQTGFDADQAYAVAATYQLINASTQEVVLESAPTPQLGGVAHDQSGDKTWHIDFSSVTTPGTYYLLDAANGVRSDDFRIADDVYREVLKHAVRSFFYQRAGFAKDAEFAGAAWADGASHLGALQDTHARLYSTPDDAGSERDLSGGWYDAGDFNKYTAWTGDYVAQLLRAYEETPSAFGDDYGLPESGNGQPDILDEARFGLTHLVRLQEPSGGVLSIVSLSHKSPPSSATGPSLYGPATTNATIRAALAYSAGARAFADIDATFANDLADRAENAWDWAESNPAVTFRNNEGAAKDIGAGQQEISAADLALYKNCLAVELYRLTGDATYKTFFEANYDGGSYGPLNNYVDAWALRFHDYYLDYAALDDANATVRDAFLNGFTGGMASADNLGFLSNAPDPYLAYVSNGNYTWGSNAHKSAKGSLFYSYVLYELDAAQTANAERAAERYLHYIHGVNPLGIVYLSNMGDLGAHRSVTQFYHTWFGDGTDWDEVGVSTYGPPPGYLVGGPNPSYCSDCGGTPLSPPSGQPAQKSYLDFNDNWPLNSWEVTENSDGYQVAYIRLLSKFVQ